MGLSLGTMDRKWSIFEIVALAICGFLAIGAIFALRLYSPKDKVPTPALVVWGTLPQQQMIQFFSVLKQTTPYLEKISYVELPKDRYYQKLLEVFASGASERPDLFLIDQANFLEFENKIYDISASFPPAALKSEYVEACETFLVGGAVRAVPFYIDPLVLYWNRDMFANAGLSKPPESWTELITMTPKLTEFDSSLTIRQSAIALGGYDNIRNARGILSALFLQSDLRIVDTGSAARYLVDLGEGGRGEGEAPGESVLRYYADFSNPTKNVYTWNSSRPMDREEFVAGSLALYIGFASEYEELRKANPNLNFDIAPLPQRPTAKRRTTYAQVYGFVVPKQVPVEIAQAAVQVARMLSSKYALEQFQTLYALPPIRRDLVVAPQTTTYGTVTYTSSLMARSWLEPSKSVTDTAFNTMVRSVVSGASAPSSAVGTASNELRVALDALQRR